MKPTQFLLILVQLLIPWLSSVSVSGAPDTPIHDSGPHHRTILEPLQTQEAPTGWKLVTNRFVQLADGLNYQPRPGLWTPSNPRFQITNGWAIANECQHKAAVCLQLRRHGGIILTQPDGSQLRSHLVGLSYFDTATGQSVLIAEPKESRGFLVHPSQVLFRDGFDDVDADVRYTMSLQGFEQDVIFRRPPPSPTEFGLSPESTRLEVLTEFTQSPEPRISRRSLPNRSSSKGVETDSDEDQTLEFGSMTAGPGRVFGETSTNTTLALVAKRWMRLSQRPFLVESIPYGEIVSSFQELDPNAGASIPHPIPSRPRNAPLRQPSFHRLQRTLPASETWQAATTATPSDSTPSDPTPPLAATDTPAPGVVIDYLFTLSSSSAPMRFRADTTYYISGNLTVGGATFEGGTVLKYAPGASLSVEAAVSEETSRIRPVIFTAATDDSVGDPILLGSSPFPRPSPSGTFGAPCLWIKGSGSGSAYPCTLDASNFLFAHAATGLRLQGGPSHSLRNSQFRECATAIELIGSSGQSLSATFLNGLIVRCTNAFAASGAAVHISGQHLTIVSSKKLRSGIPPGVFDLRNSLLVDVLDLSGANLGTDKGNALAGIPSTVFSTAGLGAYYLPAGSVHSQACTTNSLDPRLIADLSLRSTRPPTILDGTITGTRTLTPLPSKANSTPRIDRGFHYPALDFIVSNLRIAHGQLIIAPGCTLGIFGPSGFILGPSGSLTTLGSPTAPISITRLQAIQERTLPATPLQASAVLRSLEESLIKSESAGVNSTEFSAAYTFMSVPAGTGALLTGNPSVGKLVLRHSQLYGGLLSLTSPSSNSCSASLEDMFCHGTQLRLSSTSNSLSARIRRCSIRSSRILLEASALDTWQLGDSIFHDVELYYPTSGIAWANNAFCRATNITSSGLRTLIATANLPGTNSFALGSLQWAQGPYGYCYYTTSSLRDRGSIAAPQVGLFHHTTSPAQTKELTSLLDLGYHAPASSNGHPIDTDQDGLSDLDEDTDGNGILAGVSPNSDPFSAETSFTSPDTDADGTSDSAERRRSTHPRFPDPLPESMIAEWNFNAPTFTTTHGDPALNGSIATPDPRTWDSHAARISVIPASGTTPTQYQHLTYAWIRANGLPLITPETGTLQFWFKPNWSSRTNGLPEDGITTPRKLISIQAPGDETEYWSLHLNSNGTQATFSTLRSGAAAPRSVSWNIAFAKDVWTQLTLTFSRSGIELWKNAQRLQPFTPSLGTESWPISSPALKQVFIGGWSTPSLPRTANGSFEGVRSFNHLLNPETILNHYSSIGKSDSDGDGLPDLLELQLVGFSASNRDSDSDGLPDSWEYDFFKNNQAHPLGDADSDGANNLHEFIQGRNPVLKDTPWTQEAFHHLVRNPTDLINIDFATFPRFSQTGERTRYYDQTPIAPIVASMGSTSGAPNPTEDLWNILTPEQLLHGETIGQSTPIRTAAGGNTSLRFSAVYGPIQKWSSDECAQTIADILNDRRPTSYPEYPDLGIPITRPSLPPIPLATTLEGWCRPAFGSAPIQPNSGSLPSLDPFDGWQPPSSWWLGSQFFQFQAACGGPVGGPRLLAAPSPFAPGTGITRDGTYDALKHLSDYPPCSGTILQFIRPAFQSGSEFANTTTDWSSASVTTHPMFVDYLTTTEESASWRSLLESNGYDLSNAHSRLQISGIPPGPWRVLVYSASENDQRSCSIILQPATSTFIPFSNIPTWEPSTSDSLIPVSDAAPERIVTSIHPGARHSPEWIEQRHYIQATVDISADGVLNLQFLKNAALNGIQLVRLRPLEPPLWIHPTPTNTPGGVVLRWNPVPTASHYTVQRSETPNGPWTELIAELHGTAHRDTSATPFPNGSPRPYWYRILAFNERFQSTSEISSTTVSSQSIANRPPVLSRFEPLGPAFQFQSFEIGIEDLRARAMASDFDSDPLEFRVERILAGSLSLNGSIITDADLQALNKTNALAALIRKGSHLLWHPSIDLPGLVPAIELRAFDGSQFSDQSVSLPILVKAPNQVVWWGSNLSETAGNGQSIDNLALESKYPGRRRYIRSDPEYWSSTPSPVSGPDNGKLLNVTQLAAKNDVTAALKGDGTLWSWGRADARLGLGNPTCPTPTGSCDLPWFVADSKVTPHPILFPPGTGDIRQVALGNSHAAALANDGTVYLWGAAAYLAEGMIDAPTAVLNILPSSSLRTGTTIGRYDPSNPEERENARRFATLGTGTPTLVPTLNNVRQIACSDHAVAILTHDGIVMDWGTLTYLDTREFRSGPGGAISTLGAHRRLLDSAGATPRTFPSRPIHIAATANVFFATLESGEVYAWGANDSGGFADPHWTFDITDSQSVGTLIPRRIPGLANIRSVSASDSYALAVSHNGTVFEWGRTLTTGQPIQPPRPLPNLPKIESISVTTSAAFALDAQGHAWAWGQNGDFGSSPEYSSISGLIDPNRFQDDIPHPHPFQSLPALFAVSAPNSASFHAVASVVPTSPQQLEATSTGHSIRLTWKAYPSTTHYSVYRSTSPSSGFALHFSTPSSPQPVQEAFDSSIIAGRTYYYRVAAVVAGTETDPSSVAWSKVQPQPSSISGFTLLPKSRAIQLVWCPETNAQAYQIQRAGPFTTQTTAANPTHFGTSFSLSASELASRLPGSPDCTTNKLHFTDAELEPGRWYVYRIRALNDSGQGPMTESRQSPNPSTSGPPPPTITGFFQNNTTAVVQFQTNHPPQSTQWLVHLYHHHSLNASNDCLLGSAQSEPDAHDAGWILDRTAVLTDIQGSHFSQLALSVAPASPKRALLIDAIPAGVWHKIVILTETQAGLSAESIESPGNSKVFRTLNPAANPIELLTANSGPGYIYVRYRNEAGFAPTTLSPRPHPCNSQGPTTADPNQCLGFSEFPWADSGETESWILNLPALPPPQSYRLQVTPGASADTSIGLDLEFSVPERVAPSFPIQTSVADSRIRLEWFSPEWSTSFANRRFIVERIAAIENNGILPNACDPAVRWTVRAEGSGFQFEDNQLLNGSAYQYRVIALQPETGELDWQTTPVLVPAKLLSDSNQTAFASSLRATARNGAVELQWQNLTLQNSPASIVNYAIYHFASTNLPGDRIAQYSTADSTPPNTWVHFHQPLENGTTHFYQVIASIDDFATFETGFVRATPNAVAPPLPPGNIAIRQIRSTSAPTRYLLAWNPTDGARAYQVRYRLKGSTNCLGQSIVGRTQTEIVAPGTSSNPDLEFHVTAIGTGGSESDLIQCDSPSFLTPNLFGHVPSNTPRLDSDSIELVDLIVPSDPTTGIARIYTPTNITLRASIAFSDRELRTVEFFCNDQLIGTSGIHPYTFDWPNPPASNGTPLRLVAVAALHDGTRKSSPERHLDVRVRPPLSGFTHTIHDFLLKSGSESFEIQHSYDSQDLTDGILGRGWQFNFEKAQLLVPDLASGWQVVGTGLANLFAKIQEAGPSHEITAILPDGTPLRFAVSANFASTQTQRELDWLQFTGDPTDDLGAVRVEFISVDGSGASLTSLDTPETIGFVFGNTSIQGGHHLMTCTLQSQSAPYSPKHFLVKLPNGWSYEFRADPSDTNPSSPPRLAALRLHQIKGQNGGAFRFSTRNSDGTELIGTRFSHTQTKRIAIEAFSPAGISVRECWLDRLSGPLVTWALYDPVAIQLAKSALSTNANALLPGSVAALPSIRLERNANRLETVSRLIARTNSTYLTHRFGYSPTQGDLSQGISPQDLLTTITAPDGIVILRNQYQLHNGLFCLSSQQNSRGTLRTYAYNTPSRVLANTSAANGDVLAESIGYTSNGESSGYTDATGLQTVYTRDDRGRIVLEGTGNPTNSVSLLPTAVYRYDDRDNPIEITDALGNTSRKEYDSLGRVLMESDANQNSAHYQYSTQPEADGSNPKGSLISTLDPEGNTAGFRYNSRGQITARIQSITGTEAVSITRYEYYETNSNRGRIGDLRRIYEPMCTACKSLDHPLPTALPTFASEFTYDENGNTTGISRVRTIRMAVTNSLGIPMESSALELVRSVSTFDPANRQIESSQSRCQLDASNNILTNTESMLQRRLSRFAHDGRELQTTDLLGRTVTSTYDPQGNLIQIHYPDGTVQRTVVDAFGRRSLVQDRARPSIPSSTVNPATGDTIAPATEYLYDAAGRTLSVKQRLNVLLRLQPDTNYLGFIPTHPRQFTCVNATPTSVWTTNAFATNRFVHDASGRVRYHVNPQGGLVETVHDNANRVTSILHYEDRVFPLDQSPIDTTNARSLATHHGYDAAGNRVWSLQPSPANLGGHSLEPSLRTEFQYDRLNRLTTTVLPAHRGQRPSERIQYDALGNKAVVANPNGVATRYAYDLHGRMVSIALDWNPTVPDTSQPNLTRFEYDELGNLIAQIDSEGRLTRYEYDAMGRRRFRVLPGGTLLSSPTSGDIESMEFNSIPAPNGPPGVFVEQRTVKTLGGGSVLTQFDLLDRPALMVTRTTNSAPVEAQIRYEYTDWGSPSRILEFRGLPLPTAPTRITEYTYHPGSRRLESKSSPEGRIAYQHNRALQVTRMTATLGNSFLNGSVYEYDPLGRLTGVRRLSSAADAVGTLMARYQYGRGGLVDSVQLGNGLVARREYTSRNHLRRIQHQRPTATSNLELAVFNYDPDEAPLDGDGNRYSVVESFTGLSSSLTWSTNTQRARRMLYSYDRLGRLVREETLGTAPLPGSMLGTAGWVTYSLDKVGNRLSRTPSPSLLTLTPPQGPNRYDLQDHPDPDTQPNSRSPWVDAAGNTSHIPISPTTAIPSGDTYDTLGRLIVHRQAGSSVYWSYGYDERGNRISKRTEGSAARVETRFLIDDRTPAGFPHVIAEWRVEGGVTNVVRTYQIGTELICQEDGPSGANRRFLHADALGSTRMLTDNSGYPLHLFHYDAYGRLMGRLDWGFSGTNGGSWTAATTPLSNLPTQHLFAGEAWDNDLQLAYHRARYYSPNFGRFWTPDTYEGNQTRPQSLHRYAYAEANPANLLDPSGHSSLGDALTSMAIRASVAAKSTGPVATGVRVAFTVLTLASAAHDPAAFVASFESPNAAMGVLAADAGFVLYYSRRAVNFTTGFIAARMEVRPAVEEVLSQSAQRLRQLDPDVLVGFRGSVARGYKGPHKGNDPFDPNNFDVDGFVVSDKLAAKIPKIRGARFANAQNSPELAAEQQRIDGELRSKLKGLKDDDFTFRVFTYQEYFKKFKDGKLIEE